MNRSAFFFMVSITALCSSASGADTILEPFSYQEDFETRELSAWASYPPWQDTAYDQKMRVNTMVPGDPNISVVQKMIPYTNVDNYTGALKELDMYLVPGSSVSLRYYLKTNLSPEFFTIRLAAGADKKVDYTITCPPANSWEWVTVTFSDFISRNPRLAGRDRIKVNALAVLAKFPDADPAMPIYFGLDDITVKGTRAMAFRFAEPKSFKLSEWKPYIPENHYKQGDTFTLRGSWPSTFFKHYVRIDALGAHRWAMANVGRRWRWAAAKMFDAVIEACEILNRRGLVRDDRSLSVTEHAM